MQIRKNIRDGQRLSGHGNQASGYPEIVVKDGQGPGGGSSLFSIGTFHWANVSIRGDRTVFRFENKVEVAITDGVIIYEGPEEKD